MKTLHEIKVLAVQYQNEINKSAKKIHPKLLSNLNVEDFSDQTLYDNTLQIKLNNLLKDQMKYNNLIWEDASKYFKCIALDMKREYVDIGYDCTGEEITDHFFDLNNYVPSVHMEKIFLTILQYKNYIQISPFWKKEVNLYLKDKDVWINVTPASSPENYIKKGLSIINSDSIISKTDELINYIKVQLSTPYKMHTPKYKLRSSDNLDINSFITSVQDHKILEELLKMEPGSYNVQNIECHSDGTLKFKIERDE